MKTIGHVERTLVCSGLQSRPEESLQGSTVVLTLSLALTQNCPIPGFGSFRKTAQHFQIARNRKNLLMNQKNRKLPVRDEHLETLGQLLAQLRTHLTASAEKKGTYGDYLRLLDFYRETRDEQAREIIIRWVDNDKLET